jgi:hypothetical protein
MGGLVRYRLVIMRHVLLAAPPLVVTIGLAVFAGAELSGSHPLTMGAPRSVPEAIALRDEATAARMIEDGAAVDEIGLIRAGILSSQPVLATPLEAAVMVDAATAFEYLRSRGAQVRPFDSAQGRSDLSCLARDIGARAVRRQITDTPQCPPGGALQTVLDRP